MATLATDTAPGLELRWALLVVPGTALQLNCFRLMRETESPLRLTGGTAAYDLLLLIF